MSNVSAKQAEAMRLARDRGYFKIPRDATLADIADEMGITSQAASERLRLGMAELTREHVEGDASDERLRCVRCDSTVSVATIAGVGHLTCGCVGEDDDAPDAVPAHGLAEIPDRWFFVEAGDDD